MLDGFLVAHRDLIDSPMFGDADLFRFWFYLRARANYQPGQWRDVPLAIGDLIVSHRRLADQMHVSTGTIGRWLNKLEKFGEISVKAGRDFSVVSVLRTDSSERAKNGQRGADEDANRDTDKDTDEDTSGARIKTPIKTSLKKETKQLSNEGINTPLPPKGEPSEPKAMDCPSLEEFPEAIRNETCKAAWGLWLAYKRKIRQPYKTARGNRDQLTAAAQDGPIAFCGCLRNAQRHEWKGPNLRAYRELLAKGEITPAGEPAKPTANPYRQPEAAGRRVVSMREALETLEPRQ